VLHEGRLVAAGSQVELTSHLAQDRLALTVRGDAATFMEWLAASELVAKVRPLPAEEGLARADVTLEGDVREVFLPAVAGAGFGLRLVEPPDYELEDVFLGLTGGTA
jgi:hypothetical protein